MVMVMVTVRVSVTLGLVVDIRHCGDRPIFTDGPMQKKLTLTRVSRPTPAMFS